MYVRRAAAREDELWVGLDPYPANLTTTKLPVVILDRHTGSVIGHFGNRYVKDPAIDYHSSLDVGPFGISNPAQLVFHEDRLYVMDSFFERIMVYDLDLE